MLLLRPVYAVYSRLPSLFHHVFGSLALSFSLTHSLTSPVGLCSLCPLLPSGCAWVVRLASVGNCFVSDYLSYLGSVVETSLSSAQ